MTGEIRDGRLLRGEQTRRLILSRTVDIASREGLEALSLGRIATELKISKSGVFNLFGSKEELQLATIRSAGKTFVRTVVEVAMEVPPGCGRLWRLCDAYVDYVAERVFPGGCFFFSVQAEFDCRPGRVRDALRQASTRWSAIVADTVRAALTLGELADDTDVDQLTFEIIALLDASNGHSLLHDDPRAYTWARTGVANRLRSAATDPGLIPWPAASR